MKPYPFKRLSLMMALQYAVEGVWLPIAARYLTAPIAQGGLGFNGHQVGLILGLGTAVGSLCAPFVAGQIADRHFSAERFMAFLIFCGGLTRIYLASRRDFGSWLALSILYGIFYAPSLTLTNSLTFAHLTDQRKQFPAIRLWGTIGWMLASWIFPMFWLQTGQYLRWKPPFLVGTELTNVTARLGHSLIFSGVMSLFYGAYCLFLPNTPPEKTALQKLAFAKAFRFLNQPSFLVLLLVSLPVSMVHRVYYIQNPSFLSAIGLRDADIMPAASLSQLGEIVVMASLGILIARIGFRRVLTVGILAIVVRYAIFGTVALPVSVIVASQMIHGLCYACFFAAGHIYVDRIVPTDIRHSAQTLFGLCAFGVGPILGGFFTGYIEEIFRARGIPGMYSGIWYTSAVVALATAVVFFFTFRSQCPAEMEHKS